MSDAHLETIVERYCAVLPALRVAWDDERGRRDDCDEGTLFLLLTDEVKRCLERDDTGPFARLFAEVELSMSDGSWEEGNAAATCFLENLSNASPEAYAWILPLLGDGSLGFLVDWEAQSGERTSFVSAAEAEALAVAPLCAACPAFRRFWEVEARSFSAKDGTTSSFALAAAALAFVRRLLPEGDGGAARGVFVAVDRLLETRARRFDDAFRECFLDRFVKLPWEEGRRARALLGPVAREHWVEELGLGCVKVGALRDGRFVETRALARSDEWMVQLRLPVTEIGAIVRMVVRFGGRPVARSSYRLDEDGYCCPVWTWNDDDPCGEYTLEVAWERPGGAPGAVCPPVPLSLEEAAREPPAHGP